MKCQHNLIIMSLAKCFSTTLRTLFFITLAVWSCPAQQPPQQSANTDVDLEGFWSGAFVREGSVQIVEAEFIREKDVWRAALFVPDYPARAPALSAVERDIASGQFSFNTIYGKATMTLDPAFREMVGGVGNNNTPPLRLHLKRALRPPVRKMRTESVAFKGGGGVALAGTLVLPEGDASPTTRHPVAVLVHGRGCQGRAGYVPLAALLARYGVAGFAYDKRGVGESKGDCAAQTFDEEVSDVLAAVEMLAARADVDRDRIGFVSSSAGGWVVPRVASLTKIPVAFVATRVGPATSVREQQLDNAKYISRDLKLKPEDEKLFFRYVELMFASGDEAAQFAEMQELLKHGERTGWGGEFLADTDVAKSAAEIKKLWVRRYNYDPREDLKKMRAPFLAVYGGADRVVPPDENVPELRRLLTEAGNTNFRVVVIPEAGHGLDQGARLQRLGGAARDRMEVFYWKFGRTAPDYTGALIEFILASVGKGKG